MADLGNIGRIVFEEDVGVWSPYLEKRLLARRTGSYVISGVVRDKNGNLAARGVRLYRASDGALIDYTVSNATTGAYSVSSLYSGAHVVVFDDESDRNALIYTGVTPVVPTP